MSPSISCRPLWSMWPGFFQQSDHAPLRADAKRGRRRGPAYQPVVWK